MHVILYIPIDYVYLQFVDIGNKQLGYDFTTVVYRSSNSLSEPQIKIKLTAEFSFDFKDYICENCIKVFEADIAWSNKYTST